MRFSLLPGFEYGRSIMLYALGNHRSHGVAILVAVSLPAFAQWSASDSYHLNQIYFQLGGDYNSSHSIHSDLTQVLSLQRGTFNVTSNTYELLDEFYDAFRDVLNPDLHGGYFSVKVDLVLDGYTPYVHRDLPYDPRVSAELLVTNRAETFWLEKIYNKLNLIQGSSFSQFPFAIRSEWWEDNWEDMIQYYETDDIVTYLDGQWYYGDWQTFPFLFFSLLHLDDLPSTLQSFVRTFVARYGGESYDIYLDSNSYYLSQAFQKQYGTQLLREYFETSGLDIDSFNPTNFFTSDGSISNTDNSFTNSSSVFNKFATSFLPSSLFNPEQVNTNLFEYVDANISGIPTFNPQPLQGGTRSRSSDSFDYDFEDSSVYDYNLVNPLKTATDVVQGDTDIDNKFQTLADLVNQRISSIFDTPLNNISQQPSRWSVKFRDKDGATLEEYVASQQAETADGISFACWVLESTMFAGFFFLCVRRSVRIGTAGDPPT